MLDWRAVEGSMVLSLKFHLLLLTYAVHLPQHRDVSYQALLLEPSSTFQVISGHCFVSEGNTHTMDWTVWNVWTPKIYGCVHGKHATGDAKKFTRILEVVKNCASAA